MWTVAITWLLKNWKLAIVCSLGIALVLYVLTIRAERDTYKKEVADVKAQFALYRSGAEAKQATLEAGAKAISSKYEHALAEADAQRAAKNKAIKERIAANEELKRTRVSLAAVQLLNESTRNTEEPAQAEPRDAPGPTGTQDSTVALDQVWAVVAENNKNHLACVDRLQKWINFWADYTAVVTEANSASTP